MRIPTKMCMCVHTCINNSYVSTYTYKCLHIYVCKYTYRVRAARRSYGRGAECKWLGVIEHIHTSYIYKYACMCLHIYVYIYIYIYAYMYIWLAQPGGAMGVAPSASGYESLSIYIHHTYMSCMYASTYIYVLSTYIHICIYMYMYINDSRSQAELWARRQVRGVMSHRAYTNIIHISICMYVSTYIYI